MPTKLAGKVTGISCYFTKVDSGEKMLLTVYRDRASREYVLDDTDFRNSHINTLCDIEVKHNSKGNVKLASAKPVN